jgi:hypothetical protein
MVKGKYDFYHENYRTVDAQFAIFTRALQEHGDQLRQAAQNPTNRWLRNLRVYLDALAADDLKSVRIKLLKADQPATSIGSLLDRVDAAEQKQEDNNNDDADDVDHGHSEEEHMQEEKADNRTLYPRTYSAFYGTILVDLKCWHRPPDDYCDRFAALLL